MTTPGLASVPAAGSGVTCDTCGWEAPAGSKNPAVSVRMHALRAHAEGAPKRGARGEARSIDPKTATVVDIVGTAVREGRDAIEDRTDRAPNLDELNKALGRFVGTISVSIAAIAAETDPTVQTIEDRDVIVNYLSLAPAAARDVAYPFARAFGRSKLNHKYGRAVVDNVDVASALAELTMMGIHWRRYLDARARRVSELQAPAVAPTLGMVPASPQPATTGAPDAAGGKVLGFEDVQRMRAGQPGPG